MSFDLPLTAFALESTGHAALAADEPQTLTFAAGEGEATVTLPAAAAGEPHALHGARADAAVWALTLTY